MKEWISILLVVCVGLVLVGGFANRLYCKKGIGASFTKCMIGLVNPLIAALLLLNGALSDGAVAALLAGPFGYILGMKGDESAG